MNRDAHMAWLLADAAKPCLNPDQRTMVYIDIGCGDNHLAIETILAAVAHNHASLPAAVLNTLNTWLDQYIGSPEEYRLRTLIDMI